MKVRVVNESGYENAMLGISFSWASNPERSKEIAPILAHKQGGHNSFLEHIFVWLDVTASRGWWQEASRYRMSSQLSESTMHTITKRLLTKDDFEYPLEDDFLWEINNQINWYNDKNNDAEDRKDYFLAIKNMLPEGFLQRRIWTMNYKTLQNVYNQRYHHKLPQWKILLDTILSQIEHPEFIRRPNEKDRTGK